MHHPEVEVNLSIGIGFAKNPKKVISYLSHLKEFFYFIVGAHFLIIKLPVSKEA